MNSIPILCLALLPLAQQPSDGLTYADEIVETCPEICPASNTFSQTSPSAPCGTWYLAAIPPENGTHDGDCVTCTPCEQSFFFSYYGGASGCCASVQAADGNWSAPRSSYARNGRLIQNCDNDGSPGYSQFQARIGPCDTDPASWNWTATLQLNCGCQ